MGFFGKSKFKNKTTWWEDEENYYSAKNKQSYHNYTGYTGGYYYQRPLDMSVSLETRAIQLISGITGKRVKVVSSTGWGLKDGYFFYNPADLQNATDDEILGRIVHFIAQFQYADKVNFSNDADKPYQELHDALEENRADTLLQERYKGARFYARSLWERIKYSENPINILEKAKQANKGKQDYTFENFIEDNYVTQSAEWMQDHIVPLKENYRSFCQARGVGRVLDENPAWEFNFNIKAKQNGEVDYDFSEQKILDQFNLALPYIEKYLVETDEGVLNALFSEIKKYYPIPDQQQQEQMQNQQNQQGQQTTLSQSAMQQLIAQALEHKKSLEGATEGVNAQEHFFGKKGTLDIADHKVKRALGEYQAAKARNQAAINVLHSFIKSILKDNESIQHSDGHKRGKLDAKRMYKYVAQDNMRIFKRPVTPSDKRYVMTIMVDMSGSMEEEAQYAFEGTLILAEVFDMLGLPYEIIGFEGKPYIFKSFGRQLQRAILPSIMEVDGGTNDYAALNLVKKHLVSEVGIGDRQPKGIFVITDGGSGMPREMKELVQELETKQNCKVYGIGIGGVSKKSLEGIYTQSLVVPNTADLPKELTNLMRGQFRRG